MALCGCLGPFFCVRVRRSLGLLCLLLAAFFLHHLCSFIGRRRFLNEVEARKRALQVTVSQVAARGATF